MSAPRVAAVGNRIMDSLSGREYAKLLAVSERIACTAGNVLCQRGGAARHVFFPVSGFVSLISSVDAREGMEVGLVGSEGMVGVSIVLGVATTPLLARVQGPGDVLRIEAKPFRLALAESPGLSRVVHRYVHVLLAQFAQNAACARFHPLSARLARWLLTTQDRARASVVRLTHVDLAHMLGVRRVGVTNAAGVLQRQGLVSYARGEIRILDRGGLQKVSCECYAVARHTYESAMS